MLVPWRVEFLALPGKRATTWLVFVKVSYRCVVLFVLAPFLLSHMFCRRHFSRRSDADPMPEIDFEKDKMSA